MVCKLNSHIQQFPFPCGIKIGDARFNQMPPIIIFVHTHVAPFLVWFLQCVKSIDITIGLLGCRNFIDPTIGSFFNIGISFYFQGIGDRLQGFKNVRIVIKNTFKISFAQARCDFKISNTRRFKFCLIHTNGNSNICYFFHSGLPKCVFNSNL